LEFTESPGKVGSFAKVSEYIEIFYNRQRQQERLGYLSPVQLRSDTMQI